MTTKRVYHFPEVEPRAEAWLEGKIPPSEYFAAVRADSERDALKDADRAMRRGEGLDAASAPRTPSPA